MLVFEGSEYLTESENEEENTIVLVEMATLRKFETGLPVNIFVDDGGTWSKTGHGKRIKFQPDTGNTPITKNMIPMSIEDEPRILIKNPKLSINSKQINQIKLFIRINKDILLNVEKIGWLKFGQLMKKV